MANKMVGRNEWAAYMECGAPKAFAQIGEGFTSFSESKNPKEYTRQYVHERTERADVVGYAPSIAYSVDVYSGDPVIDEIVKITDEELVGSDAQRNVVTVNLWEQVSDAAGKFRAYSRTYAVIPDTKGEGSDALVYTGTLKAVGDVVKGVFDTATKAFTPDGESA